VAGEFTKTSTKYQYVPGNYENVDGKHITDIIEKFNVKYGSLSQSRHSL